MPNENQDPLAAAKQLIDQCVAGIQAAVAEGKSGAASDPEDEAIPTAPDTRKPEPAARYVTCSTEKVQPFDDDKRQKAADALTWAAEEAILTECGLTLSTEQMQVVDGKVTFCGMLKKQIEIYAWEQAELICQYHGMLVRRESGGSVTDMPN